MGSAESVAWSSDGGHLLVLAADPGSYGLDWSARAVNGADPDPDPIVRRPGELRRRLFLIDLVDGNAKEVGPPDLSVWEVDWDGDDPVIAIVSQRPLGLGLVRARGRPLDLASARPASSTTPRGRWRVLPLSPEADRAIVVEGYASDHGLLAGNVVLIDLPPG